MDVLYVYVTSSRQTSAKNQDEITTPYIFFFHAGITLFNSGCNLGQSQFSKAANIAGAEQEFSCGFRALKVKQFKVRKARSALLEEQAFLTLSLFT